MKTKHGKLKGLSWLGKVVQNMTDQFFFAFTFNYPT
jgi:hypothetical protein